MAKYGVYEGLDGSVHVIALRDAGKHWLDDLCWCEPKREDDTYIHQDLQ